MIRRNFLKMSILLVGAFLCQHFYEAKIQSKLNAYQLVLDGIIEDQKMSINSMSFVGDYFYTAIDSERSDIKDLISDYEFIEGFIKNNDVQRIERLVKILEKYSIENDISKRKTIVSKTIQFKFFEKVEQNLNKIWAVFSEREKWRASNNFNVIIENRESSYSVDTKYELDLTAVELYRYNENISSLHIEVDGIMDTIITFPYEISYLPESVKFLFEGVNVVTGESFKGDEVHQIKP